MSQLRFQVQGTRASSAARAAEDAKSSSALAAEQPTRIRAGSAARIAEEAKRQGTSSAHGMATVSLRAANGQVTRRSPGAALASSAVIESGSDVQNPLPTGTEGAFASFSSVSTAPPQGDQLKSWASSLPAKANRLTSMIRALFTSDEPSNPS